MFARNLTEHTLRHMYISETNEGGNLRISYTNEGYNLSISYAPNRPSKKTDALYESDNLNKSLQFKSTSRLF